VVGDTGVGGSKLTIGRVSDRIDKRGDLSALDRLLAISACSGLGDSGRPEIGREYPREGEEEVGILWIALSQLCGT